MPVTGPYGSRQKGGWGTSSCASFDLSHSPALRNTVLVWKKKILIREDCSPQNTVLVLGREMISTPASEDGHHRYGVCVQRHVEADGVPHPFAPKRWLPAGRAPRSGQGRAGQGGPASPPSSEVWQPAAGAGAGRRWPSGRWAAAAGDGGGRHPVRQGATWGARTGVAGAAGGARDHPRRGA